MGATFSRVKTWVSTEDVTYSDLNAEFDNILNNFTPSGMDDYSATVAQMQSTVDAGEVGTESQATSLAGEIQRLRFEVKAIKGSGAAQWYSNPPTDLTALNTSFGGGLPANRVISGAKSAKSSRSAFLTCTGTTAAVTCTGSTTNFVYAVAGTQYTISSNVSVTGITVAPASQNTCLVNDPGMSGQTWTKYAGEYGSSIIIDTVGTNITALVGKLAAFKVGSTEYFLARVRSATELHEVRRGFFFDSTGAAVDRVALSDNDTITLLKLTWVFANTSGALTISYNEPTVSGTQPQSPATGDYWYDTVNAVWKIYNATQWDTSNATLIGICAQDSAHTVCVRSFDFFSSFSSDGDTAELIPDSNDAGAVAALIPGNRVTVFGTSVYFDHARLAWNLGTDLVSGLTEAADTTYFCYLTEGGIPYLDVIGPHERPDLFGLYHPHETWRCFGHIYNDNSSNIEHVVSYHDQDTRQPYVSQFVASSALNVRIHGAPHKRIRIPKDGGYDEVGVLPGMKFVVSSGSTLGLTSAQSGYLNIYVLSYAGRAEIAVANKQQYLDGSAQTTTAEGGAGAADSATTLYSTAARTSVPVKLLQRAKSTQATAGTWATALTPFLPVLGAFGWAKLNFYTSTGTWTKPERLKRALVIVTGAGGGGGGNGGAGASSGGGAGGTVIKFYEACDLPDSVTYTINAGGTAGSTGGGDGGAGGSTTFGALLTAGGGGAGGGNTTSTFGGTSGTATGGDINLVGGAGQVSGGAGGAGGASFWGGGGKGGGTSTQNGHDGATYGSGAGGANGASGGALGGVGAAGCCLVLEIYE